MTPQQQHPASSPAVKRALKALIALGLLVFFMVFIGGYVRLSGSGLSIPGWPRIAYHMHANPADPSSEKVLIKRWLPPTDDANWAAMMDEYHREVQGLTIPKVPGRTEIAQFKTMFFIEYSHRATATLIGLAYLALLVVTLRNADVRRVIGGMVYTIGILIILQAVLGGLVVLKRLPAEKVALHLTTAFVIFSLTIWCAMRLLHPHEAGAGANPLLSWGRFAFYATYVQVFIGGLVAGSGAGYSMNTWPMMGDHWVPPGMWSPMYNPAWLNLLENQVTLQFMHRWWAVAVVALIMAMAFRAMTLEVPATARVALRTVLGVVALQFFLGVYTLLSHVNLWVALSHQMIGLTLVGVLTVIYYEAKHRAVVAEEAIASRPAADSSPARAGDGKAAHA